MFAKLKGDLVKFFPSNELTVLSLLVKVVIKIKGIMTWASKMSPENSPVVYDGYSKKKQKLID